jgi:uncharacterized iron-regulated membrane protein
MTSRTRAIALKIHLYLGLTTGLVILILCVTGTILSFEAEITRALHPERFHVEGTGGPAPASAVVEAVHAADPEASIGGITMYSDLSRPWDVNLGRAGRAFVDPHTSTVIASGVRRPAFFQKTMELHRWLLADDLGGMITGAATVMFVVLLFAGIIIWWPKTRGAFKARINPLAVFSKHGGGRRKLHDLHVALGIWCWPVLLMIALTGLPEAYGWATSALYTITGSPRPAQPPQSTSDSTLPTMKIDSVVALARATFPEARTLSIRLPSRTTGALSVGSVPETESSDRHSDNAYFDRVRGTLLRMDRYAELSAGTRSRRMVEPWHTGAAWGVGGKLLIFLVTLLGASFPVTGLLMYRAGKRVAS